MKKFKQGRPGSREDRGRPDRGAQDRRLTDRERQDKGRQNAAGPAHKAPAPKAANPPGGDKVWLYGTHAVLAAWNNPRRACYRLLATAEASNRLRQGVANRPGPEIVERQEIERHLPPGAVHQSLALLLGPLPETAIEDICRDTEAMDKAIIVVLDQAVDPQNIGAILRSAAAFGAQAVILPSRHSPAATPALAKAASGALEALPIVSVANLARALAELKDLGFWCVGLDATGTRPLAALGLGPQTALVLGSEGRGLRRLTRERCDDIAHLPTRGAIRSLNVSNAAAVALYEVARAWPAA